MEIREAESQVFWYGYRLRKEVRGGLRRGEWKLAAYKGKHVHDGAAGIHALSDHGAAGGHQRKYC